MRKFILNLSNYCAPFCVSFKLAWCSISAYKTCSMKLWPQFCSSFVFDRQTKQQILPDGKHFMAENRVKFRRHLASKKYPESVCYIEIDSWCLATIMYTKSLAYLELYKQWYFINISIRLSFHPSIKPCMQTCIYYWLFGKNVLWIFVCKIMAHCSLLAYLMDGKTAY